MLHIRSDIYCIGLKEILFSNINKYMCPITFTVCNFKKHDDTYVSKEKPEYAAIVINKLGVFNLQRTVNFRKNVLSTII